VEWAEQLAPGELGIGLASTIERIRRERDDGVDLRVDLGDAGKIGPDDVLGRDLAGSNQLGQAAG
jgi:hypothetical protein